MSARERELEERIERIGALGCDLLAALQPWEFHGAAVRSAAARLTVALAAMPLPALSGSVAPTPPITDEDYSRAANDYAGEARVSGVRDTATLDLTLRCPTCGRRADVCFVHGEDWKKRRVSASGGPMSDELAATVLERMSQDSGPAECEPFTGWCVDLAREVLALQAVLTQHEQALERIGAIRPRCVEWLRERGIIFTSWPSSGFKTVEPDQWEEIAGWIYTFVVETESAARAALEAR